MSIGLHLSSTWQKAAAEFYLYSFLQDSLKKTSPYSSRPGATIVQKYSHQFELNNPKEYSGNWHKDRHTLLWIPTSLNYHFSPKIPYTSWEARSSSDGWCSRPNPFLILDIGCVCWGLDLVHIFFSPTIASSSPRSCWIDPLVPLTLLDNYERKSNLCLHSQTLLRPTNFSLVVGRAKWPISPKGI